MESSAFQLRLILTSVALGISMSCNIRSNDTQYSNDSLANESRSGSSDEGLPDNDSALNYRNGVTLNAEKDISDSVQLPNPILESIKNDSLLNNAEIIEKIKKVDNGITLFEVVFFPVNGKKANITFDADGNRRQKP